MFLARCLLFVCACTLLCGRGIKRRPTRLTVSLLVQTSEVGPLLVRSRNRIRVSVTVRVSLGFRDTVRI